MLMAPGTNFSGEGNKNFCFRGRLASAVPPYSPNLQLSTMKLQETASIEARNRRMLAEAYMERCSLAENG